GGHQVRVTVVIEPRRFPAGNARVIFIRPDDAEDFVAIEAFVVSRDAGPELRDFQEHLRAGKVEKVAVARHFGILPDVIGNGRVDVALEQRFIGNPPARSRVEMHDLTFLAAIAAALPRKHRAAIAGGARGAARFFQAAVAIEQQRARDFRDVEIEQREDEQLVPKDMPAISLAMPAACRHAGIESDGMRRGGLEQMKDVQVQDHPRLAPAIGLLDGYVEAPPELSHAATCTDSSFPNRSAHCISLRASIPHSEIARSRDVNIAITSSMVTARPFSSSTANV